MKKILFNDILKTDSNVMSKWIATHVSIFRDFDNDFATFGVHCNFCLYVIRVHTRSTISHVGTIDHFDDLSSFVLQWIFVSIPHSDDKRNLISMCIIRSKNDSDSTWMSSFSSLIYKYSSRMFFNDTIEMIDLTRCLS